MSLWRVRLGPAATAALHGRPRSSVLPAVSRAGARVRGRSGLALRCPFGSGCPEAARARPGTPRAYRACIGQGQPPCPGCRWGVRQGRGDGAEEMWLRCDTVTFSTAGLGVGRSRVRLGAWCSCCAPREGCSAHGPGACFCAPLPSGAVLCSAEGVSSLRGWEKV